MSDILNLDGSHPGASQNGFQHNTQSSRSQNTNGFRLSKLPKFTQSTNLLEVERNTKKILQEYGLSEIKTLVIPETDYFPVIIIARMDSASGKNIITYVPYVLLNDKPIIFNRDRGISSEISPQEAFLVEKLLGGPYRYLTEDYISKNLDVFSRGINPEDVVYFSSSVVLVNKETDLNNEKNIKNLFVQNAIYTLHDVLSKNGVLSENQLKELYLNLEQGDNFQNDIEYHKTTKHTLNDSNKPTRTDITSKYSKVIRNPWAGNDSLMKTTVSNICESGGFIDIVVQEAFENNVKYLKFLPRYVQTYFKQNIDDKAVNLNSILMCLVTAAQSAGGEEWIKTFKPNIVNKKEKNHKDITGFLPYSGKPYFRGNVAITEPGLLNALPLDVVDTELVNFARAYSIPGTVYSIDISLRSSESYASEDLILAADGNTKSIEYILTMANLFTNGKFMQHYNSTENPMFIHDFNNVILPEGTWIDKSGNIQDLRVADLLYHMNLNYQECLNNKIDIHHGPILTNYLDLFVNIGSNYDNSTRLDRMKQHYINILGESVTFTGITRRVTFNDKFIDAFCNAIQSMVNITVKSEKLAINNYNIAPTVQMKGSTAFIAGYSHQPSNFGRGWR